jgi:hypothetical protein
MGMRIPEGKLSAVMVLEGFGFRAEISSQPPPFLASLYEKVHMRVVRYDPSMERKLLANRFQWLDYRMVRAMKKI